MTGKEVIAVIGAGNEYRRDDGVGIAVARLMQNVRLANVRTSQSIPDGAALMEAWRDADSAFVVDCTVSGTRPGTIYRWDARTAPLPTALAAGPSTHAFSIAQAIELARTLRALPPALIVYGIEGSDFSHGEGLTPAVATAAQEVVARIMSEIRRSGSGPS